MHDTKQMSPERRQQYWDDILEKFSQSQQSGAEFCRENRINSDQFYYHKKRKEESIILASKGKAFLPVELPQPNIRNIEISIGSAIITLPADLPKDSLAVIFGAIEFAS